VSKGYYVIPIFVPHLGCPHDCVFCNQKRISGVVNPLSSDELHKDIDTVLSTLDYANNPRVEIAFFGGSFTGIEVALQEQYLEIGQSYIKKGLVHGLRLSTRPDYIDEGTLGRLKKYGVEVIELGVQSMHEDVLGASNRGHTVQDVLKASRLIKSHGFVLGHQLMPGLPGDTVNRFKQTVDMSLELEPDIIRLYPTLVIKETDLADAYRDERYIPMTLDEAVEACAYGLEQALKRDIQVIRIGLQPTEAVSETGDVLGGPFHPTFRQLVEGELFIRKIKNYLPRFCGSCEDCKGKILEITCPPNQISSVSGLNKRNKIALQEAYGFSKIKIVGCKDLVPYTIVVEVS